MQLNLEYTCTLSQEELPGNLKKHLILLNVGIHNSKTSKEINVDMINTCVSNLCILILMND